MFCGLYRSSRDYAQQGNVYSSYKHHTTMKVLIAVTPKGAACFISDLYEGSVSDVRVRGATLKVGGLTSDSKWGGGGAENTLSSVTLYNFQKSGGAQAPPAPPPPRALDVDIFEKCGHKTH